MASPHAEAVRQWKIVAHMAVWPTSHPSRKLPPINPTPPWRRPSEVKPVKRAQVPIQTRWHKATASRRQFERKCEGAPSPKTPPVSDSGYKEKMEEEEEYKEEEEYNEEEEEYDKEAEDAVEMVEVEVEEEGEEEKAEVEMVEDEAEEIENDGAQEDDEEEEREPYGVEVEDDGDMDILKGIQRDPFSYADRQYMPPGGSCEKEVPWPPGRRPRARGGWRARLVAEGWVPIDTRPYWTVPAFQHWKPINT